MARNGSGTYSLASGNPVVTATTITSTWANNTLSDLATAMTASIANDGQTSIAANLPMSTYRHTGVGVGVATTDYCRVDQAQNQSLSYLTAVAGTADVITAVAAPIPAAYVAGQTFRFIAGGTNTTNVTINISSLGAVAITKNGATALIAGDLIANKLYEITYDGTRFQVASLSTVDIGSVTGLGTGVATALAINVGSAGAPVVFNGALGTPSSGVISNCTSTSMVMVTPVLGTPTSGTLSGCTVDGTTTVGFRGIPIGTSTTTLVLADAGKTQYYTGTATVTIPTNASVAFPVGTAITFVMDHASQTLTFTTTSLTVYKAGTAAAWASGGTLSVRGVCTFLKVATDTWYVSGATLS